MKYFQLRSERLEWVRSSGVYDGLDRLRLVRQPDNVALAVATYTPQGLVGRKFNFQTMGYDGLGRLTSTSTALGNGYDHGVGLGYNAASQIVTRTQANDAYAFTGYVNVSRGYQKNGLNRYTQAGNLTLSYDPNGNLTSNSISGYGYDVENRLVSGPGTVLTWDPLGRLYQVAGSSGTTQFVYDGDRLTLEYAGGSIARRYVHGSGDDEPLYWYEGSKSQKTAELALFEAHSGASGRRQTPTLVSAVTRNT